MSQTNLLLLQIEPQAWS